MVVSGLWVFWPNDVCDVAVLCGFARPRWKVRLRESVRFEEGKHASAQVVSLEPPSLYKACRVSMFPADSQKVYEVWLVMGEHGFFPRQEFHGCRQGFS